MTIVNNAAYPSNSTYALFNAWCKIISDGMATIGWVKDDATGQTDWVTNTTIPNTTNQKVGLDVWRTNDALTPYYLRIDYGSGGGATYPCIWITLGTAVNSSGVIGGTYGGTTQAEIYSPADPTTITRPIVICGGLNWVSAAIFTEYSTSYSPMIFTIERIKDVSGNDTDNGMSVHAMGQISSSRYADQQVIPKTGTPIAIDHTNNAVPLWPIMAPTYARTSTKIGTTIGVYTIHPMSQVHHAAILGAVGAHAAATPDVQYPTVFTVNRYGTPHNYLSLGFVSGGPSNIIGSPQYISPAIRYE